MTGSYMKCNTWFKWLLVFSVYETNAKDNKAIGTPANIYLFKAAIETIESVTSFLCFCC